MVSSVRQILALLLASIGFTSSIVICALPRWKVTTFMGTNILDFGVVLLGLWMTCVGQSTRQMQCNGYDSLSSDLQAARALVIISIILGVFGIVLSVVGGKFTTFIKDQRRKSRVVISAGIIFIISGLMVLVPVCWITSSIVMDYNKPSIQKYELGVSLFIGWFTAVLLVLGGGLLCSSCPSREETNPGVRFTA